LNRQFSKEVQMASKYTKQCLTSLFMKEMQIKTILRFQLTLDRISIIKKTNSNKNWQRSEGKGTCIHCRNVNWYSHYWNQYGGFLKKLKIEKHDLVVPLMGINANECESAHSQDTCTSVYRSTIHTSQATKSVHIPINKWMDKEDAEYLHNEYCSAIRKNKIMSFIWK
jgi:hypothetical protein